MTWRLMKWDPCFCCNGDGGKCTNNSLEVWITCPDCNGDGGEDVEMDTEECIEHLLDRIEELEDKLNEESSS